MQRRIYLISLAACSMIALAAAGRAQNIEPEPKHASSQPTEPDALNPGSKAASAIDNAPTTDSIKRHHERVMSDDLAATLAVGMPKYSPPKPLVKKTLDVPADLRETDKPKNGIIRLPDYVVREAPPPVFQEKDLTTNEGKAELAMKRNPGLNFGPYSELNRPIALAMYQEQERLSNLAELTDDAHAARRTGDKEASNFIMKEAQQTYIRQDTFDPTFGLGPK